jgi:FO synthase
MIIAMQNSNSRMHTPLSESAAYDLINQPISSLCKTAAQLRDAGHGEVVSYSRKVFIPLTQLCRDVCHYCTFAQTPRKMPAPYLSIQQVVDIARQGAKTNCKEALFTLGDKPELRYRAAREALDEMGYDSTISYLIAACKAVYEETGLIPHVNPGLLTREDLLQLRTVSASQGIMLENVSPRLCEPGQAHYGSPDKHPEARLETLRLAGETRVPFTSGILIGIGETRRERIDSLLALRKLDQEFGHIQEIIIQNFRPKPGTLMANAEAPSLEEHLWTIAAARLIFGPDANIQAPPNLQPEGLKQLIDAGINDWGGVSPITPDHVNPEAPWPHLEALSSATEKAGKVLAERLTVYPKYVRELADWVDPGFHTRILQLSDGHGLAYTDAWTAGSQTPPPEKIVRQAKQLPGSGPAVHSEVSAILSRAQAGKTLTERHIERLFQAHGSAFSTICQAADELRRHVNGNDVTFVVNRNINYTNICGYRCQFCAFAKGKGAEDLRGKPYDLPLEEIQRRVLEAWERGATEVCMQGGIHPSYTGETYKEICETVKAVVPEMHIHAFSPLEIWQGAETLNMPLKDYLLMLKESGLSTLPGTAAEILDDDIRKIICVDKVTTEQWMQVMRSAHQVGLKSTSTIMFGHIEGYQHWARHLLLLRELQMETGGITEFVPLPFVHMESPIYRKGRARKGPTFREAILMHAVGRLALHPHIPNIQASWVKMGVTGVELCLNAGANDLGGTLMNETISRSAGASHGQEMTAPTLESLLISMERTPRQRSTAYGPVPAHLQQRAREAKPPIQAIVPLMRKHAKRPREVAHV